MILAIDVDYRDHCAVVAGVMFSDWEDTEANEIFTSTIDEMNEYEPGNFYKRELPCILQLLNEHKLKPSTIIVDGYVFLDGNKIAGLGKHLHDALDCKTIIIGVAKRAFKDISSEYAIYRGQSNKPLYVTAVGLDVDLAFDRIKRMNGKFRVPDLLKRADQVCRGRN